MKPNTYKVLVRAVEDGVRVGWVRAHKYQDNPDPHHIQTVVEDSVVQEILEWFELDEPVSNYGGSDD